MGLLLAIIELYVLAKLIKCFMDYIYSNGDLISQKKIECKHNHFAVVAGKNLNMLIVTASQEYFNLHRLSHLIPKPITK